MKKFLSVLLFAILFVSIITGCEQQDNTAGAIAKNLDNNLNRLSVAVNKLDTIDNKYLYNPDIYSSLSAPSGSQNNKYFALAFNEMDTTQISNESVKQVLIDKITDKLFSQNSNTGDCYTCKKYCDENGNCYYTDCNGNNYCYENSGKCYECDSIPSSCEYVGIKNISCEDCENDTILTAEQLSNSIEVVDNDTISNNTDDNLEKDNLENSNETIINTPSPSVRMFYFTQDSFSPIKLKYNPRYISQYNESTINEQIESYLFKVQKLYAMSEDSIEANTILQNCKQNIIDCIKEIKDLNICILNGQCEPSIQELQALNNYIADIKTTTKRLKNCNGELNSEINKISETNANVMINSVDVMNSNYMRLLNHIDTRITYHKSAIATLEQIKYLLDSAINGNNISEEDIENIIENITIEEDVETPENQDVVSDSTTIPQTNTNIVEDENNLDNSANNETGVTKNESTENLERNDHDSNENNDYVETVTNTDNAIEEEDYTNINDDDTILEDNTENEDLYDNKNEYIEENINENADNSSVAEEENNSTIDTYNSTHSWSNIDTYKNNTDVHEDKEIIHNNITNNEADNSIIENTNTNDENVNNAENDNNKIINDNNNEVVDNSIVNESDSVIDNDNTNNIINNDTLSGTTNNGMYQNSVITQNNLNNDNGYGGYYYTADGEIKNNGMNNNNEIGNNGNTIENNLNRNNNVNTYGYNTLLDMINQGTVNNGINTL